MTVINKTANKPKISEEEANVIREHLKYLQRQIDYSLSELASKRNVDVFAAYILRMRDALEVISRVESMHRPRRA